MPPPWRASRPCCSCPSGSNDARPFGMDARERACRLAANAGLECADAPVEGRAVLLASMRYAWDPAWLKAMRSRPGTMLTLGGEPVMVHVPADMKSGMQQQLDSRIGR